MAHFGLAGFVCRAAARTAHKLKYSLYRKKRHFSNYSPPPAMTSGENTGVKCRCAVVFHLCTQAAADVPAFLAVGISQQPVTPEGA